MEIWREIATLTAAAPTPVQQFKENYHTIVLAAAGAQMEEWWGQLGPCDTALLCTVSRHTGHQPGHTAVEIITGIIYHVFTATPRLVMLC